MTSRLTLQRCWIHSDREAVARCPECTRFFCRECVVEYADRLVCSSCLAKLHTAAAAPKRKVSFVPVVRLAGAVLGLVVAWILFFSLGRMLLAVPDQFHAGTLWKRGFGDDFSEGARRK